jgi:hypothetical protein
MEFDHYQQVPPNVAEEIAKRSTGTAATRA